MRARVPNEMKGMVIERLRHFRFWYYVKYFPIIIVIFWAFFALATFAKGHAILFPLEKYTNLSRTHITIGGLALIGMITLVLMICFCWQEYHQLAFEERYYCSACDAVDTEDEGRCPFCGTALQDKAAFICTYTSEEIKLLQQVGLKASKEK